MHIVLAEPLGISEALLSEYIKPFLANGHTFTAYSDKASDDQELYERVKDADILMIANRKLPGTVIKKLTKLQMIDVAFTGVDHIDMSVCRNMGITVCNASGYSNTSVSELVIGHTINIYRHILSCDRACREGKTSNGLIGMEIKGKKVGIIGTGKIGIETARLFKAFGAEVLGWSRSVREEALQTGIKYVSLEELLSNADIISLHLPMNENTSRFFDANKISMMKSEAVLINCARGGIVDNKALAEALNEGTIAGAAIDVFDIEPPLSADDPLINAKNCLLSPHVAFLTKESMIRRAEIVFHNLSAYLAQRPENVVH